LKNQFIDSFKLQSMFSF